MPAKSQQARPLIPRLRGLLTTLIILATLGCTGVPEGIEPVSPFNAEQYLGTWYEIARLDHSFERGLTRVTAEYSRLDDGGLRVLNRGYDTENGEWQSAEGKAYFVDGEDTGHLKVSFFGPFYSSYVVFDLGSQYEHAFVTGYDRDYLWLLARSPRPDPALKTRFEARARELGYPVEELIWVEHQP